MLEDAQMQHGQSGKSRRIMVEKTTKTCVGTNSRTKCPFILGAKSGIRVDPTRGHEVGATNGLELNTSTEKDGGRRLVIGPNDGTELYK